MAECFSNDKIDYCNTCKNSFCGNCSIFMKALQDFQEAIQCHECCKGPSSKLQPARDQKKGSVWYRFSRPILSLTRRNKKNPKMAGPENGESPSISRSMPDFKAQEGTAGTDKHRLNCAEDLNTKAKFSAGPNEHDSVAVTSVEAAAGGDAVNQEEEREVLGERKMIPVTESTEIKSRVLTSTYDAKMPYKDAPCGKGLCAIIYNFTDGLKDYCKDVQEIRTFFKDKLECDILDEYCNLSHEEFDKALDQIALQLNTGAYDRFFCFILSHGCEKGILMSLDGDGLKEETGKEYPIEKMVEKFSHDKVKEMKCYPKCFFIQACRGYDKVKPAAHPCDSQPENEAANIYQGPVAVGADILLAFACNYGNPSYVFGYGSWYLQATMSCLKNCYENEHLVDIMTKVGAMVSKRVGNDNDNDNVAQMPHISSTLTKKFYLKIKSTESL